MSKEVKFDKIWRFFSFEEDALFSDVEFDDSIILFLIKGRAVVEIEDEERRYSLSSGKMTLIPRKRICNIKVKKDSRIFGCVFSIENIFSEQNLPDILISDQTSGDEICILPIKRLLRNFFSFFAKSMQEGLTSDYYMNIKRNELNLLLIALYSPTDLKKMFSAAISDNIPFKKFVFDNYKLAKNVKELAALSNYSTSGFIKKFKKYFGESPYRWMLRCRSQQILSEIEKGVKPLQEIASDYRFSSYQHFATYCKTVFGYPPSEIFRNKIMKNSSK